MHKSNQDLARKSISIENDFSSTSHAIDTITYDNPNEEVNKFPIPSRYNRDYLRLLPVNLSTYYIYWEVSDQTLQQNQLDLNHDQLIFKIYHGERIVFEFTSSFALGEYFLDQTFEDRDIHVSIGFPKDNVFTELMHSNTVHTFSNQLKWPSPEDEIWIKREKVWIDMLTSTMQSQMMGGGISSAQYIEEIERLKQLSRVNEEQFSSSSLHKGAENG